MGFRTLGTPEWWRQSLPISNPHDTEWVEFPMICRGKMYVGFPTTARQKGSGFPISTWRKKALDFRSALEEKRFGRYTSIFLNNPIEQTVHDTYVFDSGWIKSCSD